MDQTYETKVDLMEHKDRMDQIVPKGWKWSSGPKWTKERAIDQSGLNGPNGLKQTEGTEVDRNGPKRVNEQSRRKGLVCVTLHITRFMNNWVMWNTLLGTWITFGLHLDQSKYLGWGWDHTAHNSILLLSSIFIT